MTEHFAGLDVSIAETAICVVDREGVVQLEYSVPTDPEAIADALLPFRNTLRRAGHEAGALSPWPHPGPKALGVPAVCLETRHVRAVMSAQRNKTDATDAIGIAHVMRTGWFHQAHNKTDQAYRLRLLLIQRRNLKRKFLELENSIRHSLKSHALPPLAQRRRLLRIDPQRWQPGSSVDLQGHISKQGDNDVRRYLYEAAHILLTRVQGLKIARSKGHARAVTAVARKLALILFAMWRDGTEYRWGADPMAKAARRPRKIKLLEAAQ